MSFRSGIANIALWSFNLLDFESVIKPYKHIHVKILFLPIHSKFQIKFMWHFPMEILNYLGNMTLQNTANIKKGIKISLTVLVITIEFWSSVRHFYSKNKTKRNYDIFDSAVVSGSNFLIHADDITKIAKCGSNQVIRYFCINFLLESLNVHQTHIYVCACVCAYEKPLWSLRRVVIPKHSTILFGLKSIIRR